MILCHFPWYIWIKEIYFFVARPCTNWFRFYRWLKSRNGASLHGIHFGTYFFGSRRLRNLPLLSRTKTDLRFTRYHSLSCSFSTPESQGFSKLFICAFGWTKAGWHIRKCCTKIWTRAFDLDRAYNREGLQTAWPGPISCLKKISDAVNCLDIDVAQTAVSPSILNISATIQSNTIRRVSRSGHVINRLLEHFHPVDEMLLWYHHMDYDYEQLINTMRSLRTWQRWWACIKLGTAHVLPKMATYPPQIAGLQWK